MSQGQSLNAYDVSGEDCSGMGLPPVEEETQEEEEEAREQDMEDTSFPTVTETLEDAGLNDYVDHDVDFEPMPNPTNSTRPDGQSQDVPATPLRSVRPRMESP